MDEEKKVIDECCEELSPAVEEKEEEEKVHQSSCKKLCLALSIVLSLAVSRGCGAQLKFSILNDQPEQFYPPFLLMWFNNCCLLACFPGFSLFEKLLNSRRRKRTKSSSIREVFDKSARIFSKDGFSFGRFLALELLFLLLFNANNYSNSLSLGRVSTSASLTLHSFEVSLVYLMSRLFLGEKFALVKTLGVFMATGGVVLIALDNEFAADILGILFSLFACFASSVYKVSFKRLCGNASLGQSSLFLSGMGLVNLVVNFVPAYLLLHFGVETFQFWLIPWPKLIAFIFLTFVFNFATIFGLALLSPVVIAIGLLCGVPLSIGIDLAFRRLFPSWTFLLGASFLLLSALLATFHEQIRGQMPLGRKRKDEKEKESWNEEAKQLADQELADCETKTKQKPDIY